MAPWAREVVGQRKAIVVAMIWIYFDADNQATLALNLITRHGRAIVEAMVKADGGVIPKSSDEYYFAVRDMFPNVPKESDVVGRLLAFTMQACVLRLERHQAHLRKAN